MKTMFLCEGYNNKGFVVKLLTKKEAYKGIDRIRLQYYDLNSKDKIANAYHDMQKWEAVNVISGMVAAIRSIEMEKIKTKR